MRAAVQTPLCGSTPANERVEVAAWGGCRHDDTVLAGAEFLCSKEAFQTATRCFRCTTGCECLATIPLTWLLERQVSAYGLNPHLRDVQTVPPTEYHRLTPHTRGICVEKHEMTTETPDFGGAAVIAWLYLGPGNPGTARRIAVAHGCHLLPMEFSRISPKRLLGLVVVLDPNMAASV